MSEFDFEFKLRLKNGFEKDINKNAFGSFIYSIID